MSVEISPAELRQAYRMKFLEQNPKLSAREARDTLTLRPILLDENRRPILPKVLRIGDRTREMKFSWKPLHERCDDVESHISNKRLKGKVADEIDILNAYWGWRGIIEPEYDLLEPYTLVDTEAYYRQALRRMHSLMFRNGVEIMGENQTFVDYVKKRVNQVAYVMGVTFDNFLKDVLWNLLVCSNCIVTKVRDNESSGGVKSDKNENRVPVAAYAIIPPHTIFPFLDGKGHIQVWRRFYKDGRPYRDYKPEDIIHFFWDRKPGHLFGTPRTAAVRDDIFALRRLEENLELLLVHHLFPLFHVKVGTPEDPVTYLPDGSSEIDYIRAQIQNMPKEGVFVTDDRVSVDVHGAEGQGIDPQPVLDHFKRRVLVGIGVSGIDVGEADTANRSTADNVSQNLKDAIKADLSWFSGQVKMEIFKEMFTESKIKMSVQNAVADVGLGFGEIDTDGQIKQETHAMNAYNNHLLNEDEARRRMRMKPLADDERKKSHHELHIVGLEKVRHGHTKELANIDHKHALELQEKAGEQQARTAAVQAVSTKKTKVTHKSASGGSRTKETHEPTAHAQKMVAQIMQPSNQHGRNFDPHKAKSSEDPALAKAVYDELIVVLHNLQASHELDFSVWRLESGKVIDAMVDDPVLAADLKNAVALSYDEDLLLALLRAGASPNAESDDSDSDRTDG